MNIILIISDTFRQDHLGCYGNPWIQTPHLDNLSEFSVLFEQAYAASFPTMPARADLLTGKYTFTYRGWQPLPQNEITLPQLLQEAGYSTMAVVDVPFYMRNGYGYDRGFEDFIFIRGQAGPARKDVTFEQRYEKDLFAPKTFSTAGQWLERHHKEKFFLLIDTWDPHEPWDPPDYYVRRYRNDFDSQLAPTPCYCDWEKAGLTKVDLERAHDYYCGEITMVDRWVGGFIDRIDSLGLIEDTIIIFLSDHGFYFGEHRIFGKGIVSNEPGSKYFNGIWQRSPLYEEVTKIPLLVYLPGLKSKKIDSLVSLPDLMPTILDMACIDKPDFVQATSLVPLMKGEVNSIHDLIITSWPLYNVGQEIRVVDDFERRLEAPLPSSITDGKWVLIISTKGEPVEIYNIFKDPNQEQNLIDGNEDVARRLHEEYISFLREMGTDQIYLDTRLNIL